jgi:hypothetical protein
MDLPGRLMAVISTALEPLAEWGMTRRSVGFLLALLLIVFAGEARAWTPFGTVEHIEPITNVGLQTPNSEPLFLAYKTSTIYFIGGIFVHDDGYVLGLQSNPKHYVDMPPPNMLADFQSKGLLPTPLPSYRLGFGDYLAGFSLWIVVVPLAGAYLYFYFAARFGRRRRRPARH